MQEYIATHFNFWVYVIVMMTGLWAVIAKNNLLKKLIGLSIFQTAILLLYVSLSAKEGATIPILEKTADPVAEHGPSVPGGAADEKAKTVQVIDPDRYANPLPHVLMLTAIVVGVATLGVALALCQMIFKEFDTLEEREILAKIKEWHHDV